MRKSKCSFILAPPQTTSIFEAGENESGDWRWTSGLDSTYTHWFPGGGWAGKTKKLHTRAMCNPT